MADKAAIATEIYNLLVATTNATATEKQKLRDRFVALYPNHWQNFLTNNTLTDTAANRGRFAAWMTVNSYWGDVYRSGSESEIRQTQPSPETL